MNAHHTWNGAPGIANAPYNAPYLGGLSDIFLTALGLEWDTVCIRGCIISKTVVFLENNVFGRDSVLESLLDSSSCLLSLFSCAGHMTRPQDGVLERYFWK